jgi:uncharacterized glyoxalase superfamily protein PhnB
MADIKCILPVLKGSDMQKAVTFYTGVLGFTVAWRAANDGGGENCMLQAGAARLLLSTGSHLGDKPQFTGTLYFHMAGVHEFFERIKDQVEIVWPLETMDYGQKEFGIRDGDGYTLAFAEALEGASPSPGSSGRAAMPVAFQKTIPILRIFSVEKAKEFYVDYLGFSVDWEHHFEENTPAYLQVSRDGLVLHLSEHHGDCCPGSTVFVWMRGIEEFHREITGKGYKYLRPGLETTFYEAKCVQVIDPFGNRIRFNEDLKPVQAT